MSTTHSKFLSLILRHEPARFGVTLDSAGWTDVGALLAACAAHGTPITRAELEEIVAASDKQRFALDGERIRANQGHSVPVELGLAEVAPPAQLFHGTVDAALESIRREGLVRGARHHVHLSDQHGTASSVGMRRGAPVILVVRAAEMAAAGHAFYRSENGVWLADAVPAEFIEFPNVHGGVNSAGNRKGKVAIAQATLAACEAGWYASAAGERIEIAEAIESAVAGSVIHDRIPPWSSAAREARIAVTPETTLAAIARVGGGWCALNFASAKNPGGGFLGGSQAQEESLARSSALYPCQLANLEMYERQRACKTALYLDLALYSPLVPVFRDDAGAWLDRAVPTSIITCAAPNAGALRQHGRFDPDEVEDVLRRRCEMVLAIAAHHAETKLVLGAWGAGVFGNDPAIVAAAFRDLLRGRFRGAFEDVVFAVMAGPNHDAFADAFA